MAKRDDRDAKNSEDAGHARRRILRNAVRPKGTAGPGAAAGWQKTTVSLPASHKWKCSPGHCLLVADRGAVRFEYPEGWHVAPGKNGEIGVHDRPSPDEDCRILLTVIRTPGVSVRDFAALPLVDLLRQALSGAPEERKSPGWTLLTDISTIERPGMQIAWAESSWLDKEQNDRKVLSRQLVTRAAGMHPFITFDYYEDRADAFRPVWLHMVETLRVATPMSLLGDTLN